MDRSDTNTRTEVDTGSDVDSDAATDASSGSSRTFLVGGAIAAIGIITSGVMVYVLDRIGPPGSGELVWILGYGLTIFALWYLLLRPIDLTGGY